MARVTVKEDFTTETSAREEQISRVNTLSPSVRRK